MPLAEAVETTNETTTQASSQPARRRRGRRTETPQDQFIYCLSEGKGEDGKIILSKPGQKNEIELAAFRKGVNYFRIQEFSTRTVERPEGNLIVGVPVK